VLNPTAPAFNYFASVITAGSALHVAPLNTAQLSPILFHMQPSGKLVFTMPQPGSFVDLTDTDTSALLRSGVQSSDSSLFCSIQFLTAYPGQPILRCRTPGRPGAFNNFQVNQVNSFNFLYGTTETASESDTAYLVDLGVFRRNACF
jgi:hypothetical protein